MFVKLFFIIKKWFFKYWTIAYQKMEHQFLDLAPHWGLMDPVQASIVMSKIKWTKDGVKELWDASHHPYYADYIINEILREQYVDTVEAIKLARNDKAAFSELMKKVKTGEGQPEGSFDCDDFALWGASALHSKYNPVVLSVFYKNGKWPWNIGGHAVCLYEYNKRFYHIGNWGKSKGFKTKQELIDSIVVGAGAKKLAGSYEFKVNELIEKND